MKRGIAQALAGAAFLVGLTGVAQAGQTLVTSPLYIDPNSYSMYCDSTNVGSVPAMVVTEFCNHFGLALASYGPETLAPGQGVSHLAPVNQQVFYCRVTVQSGSSKNIRAMVLFAKNGRYLATADAH